MSIIKISVGWIINSVALVADGFHSISDLVTDFVVIFSNRAANRPPDSTHPYGHGKFETCGTLVIGLILLLIGGNIGWSALSSLIRQEENFPGPMVVVIAAISVVLKEILFRVTRKVAKNVDSPSLYANAWHHRSDALSSIAVLLGGCISLFGYGYGDQIAGLIVGIMVMAVAGKILFRSIKELSEHAVDGEIIRQIEQVLNEHQKIAEWHKLRTRKIGSEMFIDMHILVDPQLSVRQSHKLTEQIENQIKNKVSHPANILIHVEPNSHEMIKKE